MLFCVKMAKYADNYHTRMLGIFQVTSFAETCKIHLSAQKRNLSKPDESQSSLYRPWLRLLQQKL